MNAIQISAVTHRGKVRKDNEDSIAIAGFMSSAAAGHPVQLVAGHGCPVGCIVADGLGGHAEGGRASRIAARVISDAILLSGSADCVTGAINDANSAIYQEMTCVDAWQGMGTTVVAAVFGNGELTCVN